MHLHVTRPIVNESPTLSVEPCDRTPFFSHCLGMSSHNCIRSDTCQGPSVIRHDRYDRRETPSAVQSPYSDSFPSKNHIGHTRILGLSVSVSCCFPYSSSIFPWTASASYPRVLRASDAFPFCRNRPQAPS